MIILNTVIIANAIKHSTSNISNKMKSVENIHSTKHIIIPNMIMKILNPKHPFISPQYL